LLFYLLVFVHTDSCVFALQNSNYDRKQKQDRDTFITSLPGHLIYSPILLSSGKAICLPLHHQSTRYIMTTKLMWKTVDLYFSYTNYLIPFPLSYDRNTRSIHYETQVTRKLFPWYFLISLSTLIGLLSSIVILANETCSEERSLSYVQILGQILIAIMCLFTLLSVHVAKFLGKDAQWAFNQLVRLDATINKG
jgi:hypothetical protein